MKRTTTTVDAGWWQDIGDDWFIGVRFADWQRDRVQVENRRRENAEARRTGAHGRSDARTGRRRGGYAPPEASRAI
jgi:hypothetical protein